MNKNLDLIVCARTEHTSFGSLVNACRDGYIPALNYLHEDEKQIGLAIEYCGLSINWLNAPPPIGAVRVGARCVTEFRSEHVFVEVIEQSTHAPTVWWVRAKCGTEFAVVECNLIVVPVGVAS